MSLFLLLGITSCKKDDDPTNCNKDYLVFGHFYGECVGETCIELFKPEDNRLLEDVNDKYPCSTTFYDGQYKELPASKYALVSDLPEYLPGELLKTDVKVIGQPDAGDWGDLYIEYSQDGKKQYWLIDKRTSLFA